MATTPPTEDSSADQLAAGALEPARTADSPAPTARGEKRVKTAQRILGVTQTGKLGAPTRDALRAYQLAASLPVTGELDADTWKSLHR